MAAWFDRAVDRTNAQLVHQRVGHRAPDEPLDDAAIVEQLRRARLEPLRDVVAGMELAPVAGTTVGGFETWTSSGTDWVARCERAASPRGVALVVLHGWLAVELQIRVLRWSLGSLRRSGVDLWFPWLPYHGARTPAGALSGERFLSHDLGRTAAAVERSVGETVALLRWLRGQGQRVAVAGISLGGWVAALTATATAELDRAVLWTPVVDPADALTHSPLAEHLRRAVRLDALPPQEVEAFLRPIAPLHLEPRVEGDRVVVIGAVHDNVVSTASLTDFAERWQAQLEWAPRGHITAQWSPRCRRMVRESVLGLLSAARR